MKNTEINNIEIIEEEMLTCEFCNETSKDVEKVLDPFEVEMTGGETLVNMCDLCYMIRMEDI